jgi:predicted dehydrogenase
MINIGIIGYGYWGPNLVRNFVESGNCRVAVCDLRPDRLSLVRTRYPVVETTTDARSLISDPRIDAIAIATPVFAHYDLAAEALKAGKHIFVEKPFTSSSEEALRLIEEARKRKLVIMVDHTFVYTAAVRKIRELVQGGDLGNLYYYDSVRINLGLFQRDVDVIWDLAVHDFSIMDYVLGCRPTAISATGISHVPGGRENIAYITAFFENNLIAHIHVNWLAPLKVRRSMIGGSRKMIVYDDVEPSEKVKVYDKGISVTNVQDSTYKMMMIGYRTGDVWIPQLEITEALRTEASHFLRCIECGEEPVTGGEAGLRVVDLLESATQSMKKHGEPIKLPSTRGAAA